MKKEIRVKILMVAGGILSILLVVYGGFAIFFTKHFYFHTSAAREQIGGKKVSEVEMLLKSKAAGYSLELKERDGKSETIKGEEINFTYQIDNQVNELLEAQNPWTWPFKVWKEKELKVSEMPAFDESLLKQKFNALSCLLPANSKAPVDSSVVFENNHYVITQEEKGSLIKRDQLYKEIENAISNDKTTINIDDLGCYEEPKFTSTSKELVDEADKLNQYVECKITYNFGDRIEVLDGSIIKDWIKEDKEKHEVSLDETAVSAYVKELARKYDTLYGTRQFKTTAGKVVTVVGGDYGWRIDKQQECKALIELINKGKQEVTREPVYELEARSRNTDDVGNTYVEIDLTKQYLWFYKEGKLVTEGSIVSGTSSNGHATPEGTYRIDYVEANATLNGPGYSCPVSFWMPFNSGIGIHDAVWRGSFGGDIYVYNGSHGCINAPYTLAETIFNNIEAGVAVICYKE